MRDVLLLVLEVVLVAVGLVGVALLFGVAVALVVGAVVGVAAVEAKA